MKMRNFMKMAFAIVAMTTAIACAKDDPTPEVREVTIDVAITATAQDSITATITTTNADDVAYICLASDITAPTIDDIFSNGTVADANTNANVTLTALVPDTEYIIYAAARNDGGSQLSASKSAKTTAAASVTATIGNDIGVDYITFTYTATNARAVKYLCIETGSRDITAEQVMTNGAELDAEATDRLVKIENLKDDTSYDVHIAAEAAGVVSTPVVLTAKTLLDRVTYTLNVDSASSTISSTKTNFYVTLTDNTSGSKLFLDLYTAEAHDWLPSATYSTKSNNEEFYFSTNYTRFVTASSEIKSFADGQITVTATPNEETREIAYSIDGNLLSEAGDYEATFTYSGTIEGLSLPVVAPDVPEGAFIFEVSGTPSRVSYNEVEGEYYLKFYDTNWNELAIDLKLDPAICNNGKDALPAGTYTLADGTIDPYTYLKIYNPYFDGNFETATLVVEKNDLEYTLTFNATYIDAGESKALYMNYVGEISNIAKE